MLPSPSLCAVLAHTCLLAGCALAPEFPADSAADDLVLTAVDARGEPMPLDRLPRRPRLSIALAMSASAPNSGPWLLTGASDSALLDDLGKLPLNAAHLSRTVPIRHSWDNQRLELEPVQELEPGASYTLALARKAALGLQAPLMAELRVDASPLAGAAVRATFPPAESAAVPTDLALALISFDGAVQGSERGIWLEDERGLAHPAHAEDAPCEAYDSAAVSCIRLLPERPLDPASHYVLRSGRALIDGHGAALTELHARFSTQPEPQQGMPAWQQAACAVDEQTLPIGCALVADERIELQLFQNPAVRVLAQLDDQRIAVLPASMASPLRFDGLAADRTYTLILESIDASLMAEQISWPLRTAPALPKLTISEVSADPNGNEPEQEYVELWNFASEAQSLAGLRLSDSPKELGSELPEQVSLAPGSRALLVSDSFDPLDTRDPTPAAGSLLVRVGKSVTRGGLANSGERLYLRTNAGERVSTAPGLPAPREGKCLVRSTEDPAADSQPSTAAQATDWQLSDCSPGR